MTAILLSSLVGLASMMLLDYIWLTHIARGFYLEHLATHITSSNASLVPYLPAVPFVYIVAMLGIWLLAMPKTTTALSAFIMGSLLGFVLYAFYDLTNLATLKEYPGLLTVLDTLWGTLLIGTVTLIVYLLNGALI